MRARSTRRLASITAVISGVFCLLALAPEARSQRYGEVRRMPGFWDDPRAYVESFHFYVGTRVLGMYVPASTSTDPEEPVNSGGGIGVSGGVRLNRLVSLGLSWTGTWHGAGLDQGAGRPTLIDHSYLMTFIGDARVHIPTPGIADPYVQAGLGYALLGAAYRGGTGLSDGTFSGGPAYEAGVGIDVWLSESFSVGGKVLYRGIYLVEPDLKDRFPEASDYINGVTLDLAATLHI
jgi:hypothetical protein